MLKSPKSVFIVGKPTEQITLFIKHICCYLVRTTMLNIYVENYIALGPRIFLWENQTIDFIITLGGDGTILYCSWLFQNSTVPPVISFHVGSLGFLSVFDVKDISPVLEHVVNHESTIIKRIRLQCTIERVDGGRESFLILNDLVVDRGPSAFMSEVDVYVDDNHVTTCQGDGLVIATPTGSTAYSLAAGGSLVHPGVSLILMTPICPHSLSFRPMLLPDSVVLKIQIPKESRNSAFASFDGRHRVNLQKGDSIRVQLSEMPLYSVCKTDQHKDWFESLARCLHWNQRIRQKPLNVSDADTMELGDLACKLFGDK